MSRTLSLKPDGSSADHKDFPRLFLTYDSDPRGGEVSIRRIDNAGQKTIHVPFDALAEFVGQVLLEREVARLERLTGRDFLEEAARRG